MTVRLHGEAPTPALRKVTFKLLIMGDSSVGKSSLLRQYMCGTYEAAARSTIGADFMRRDIAVEDTVVQLQLWDTAGQERFQSLSPSFFRAADACLLVFNLCDVETFASLDGWWREMEAMCGEGKLAVVVGNKRDLVEARQVPRDAALRWCEEQTGDRAPPRYFETSAMDHDSVKAVFQHVVELALLKPLDPEPPTTPLQPPAPLPLPATCCR